MMQASSLSFFSSSVRARVRNRLVPGSGRAAGWLAASLLLLGLAAPADAQSARGGVPTATAVREENESFVAPYIGATTGGDTNVNGFTFGLSTGWFSESSWGGELDIAHSTKFNDTFEDSGLTTVMLNLMVAPRVTRQLRVFVLAGGGLIRTRGCTTNCVREISETDFGLDGGGGAIWSLSESWGVRGDLRYFRYVNTNRDVPRLDNGPFDFWRFTVGGTYTWSW